MREVQFTNNNASKLQQKNQQCYNENKFNPSESEKLYLKMKEGWL